MMSFANKPIQLFRNEVKLESVAFPNNGHGIMNRRLIDGKMRQLAFFDDEPHSFMTVRHDIGHVTPSVAIWKSC